MCVCVCWNVRNYVVTMLSMRIGTELHNMYMYVHTCTYMYGCVCVCVSTELQMGGFWKGTKDLSIHVCWNGTIRDGSYSSLVPKHVFHELTHVICDVGIGTIDLGLHFCLLFPISLGHWLSIDISTICLPVWNELWRLERQREREREICRERGREGAGDGVRKSDW